MLGFRRGHAEIVTEELVDGSEIQGESMPGHYHDPVMTEEILGYFDLKPGMTVVDATVGLGGHSARIIEKILPGGRLICLDKDQEALSLAKEHLAAFGEACLFFHEDFRHMDLALEKAGVSEVDAIIFDLGVSSYQLDNPQRGFSFKGDGPLDMRMDRRSYISAYDLLNNLTEEELASILKRFGQERYSHRIAGALVRARRKSPISTTQELAQIVRQVVPFKRTGERIHPATRTFQALRIAVNRELDALEEALHKAAHLLRKRGKICVVSFHSLEDRIVKVVFRDWSKSGKFKLLIKKILRPDAQEVMRNPRSRSARLRAIERIR